MNYSSNDFSYQDDSKKECQGDYAFPDHIHAQNLLFLSKILIDHLEQYNLILNNNLNAKLEKQWYSQNINNFS